MKKKLSVVLTAGALALSCCFGLAACNEEEPAKDTVAPVIAIQDSVIKIDCKNDVFDIYGGVTATDDDCNGAVNDITGDIKIAGLPSGVSLNAEGNAVFSKPGDYDFTYYVKDAAGNFDIAHKIVEVRNFYNIYYMSATLPALYAALDMATNNYPTVMMGSRANTIDFSCYGDRVIFNGYDANGTGALTQPKRYVASIAAADPYSYFRFFCTDLRHQLEIRVFKENGITDERYDVTMCSDGTASYTGMFPYGAENTYDLWAANKNAYTNLLLLGTANANLAYGAFTAGDGYNSDELQTLAFIAAQRDNVKWWGACASILKSEDPKVQAELDKSNIIEMKPENMYAALTAEQKDLFLQSVYYEDEVNEYFQADGKNVVFVGKNLTSITPAMFAKVFDDIKADYPGYKILYKPHPSHIPTPEKYAEHYKYLVDNNITTLPGKLPMEVISWVQSDALIGGYDSSLFMSVPYENVKFFVNRVTQPTTQSLVDAGLINGSKIYSDVV